MIAISFACESINLLCGFARDSLADVSSYVIVKNSTTRTIPKAPTVNFNFNQKAGVILSAGNKKEKTCKEAQFRAYTIEHS